MPNKSSNSASESRDIFYSVNSDTKLGSVDAVTGQELVQYYQDTAVCIWYNDLPADYEPHWHLALEIIMPLENWYDAVIGEEHFHIVPGDILFIPPGDLHTLKAPETGNRFVFLFNLSALTNLRDFASIQSILSQPLLLSHASYPDNIYNEVYQILLQMTREYFSRNQFAELTIFSLLLKLFVKLGNNHLENIELLSGMRAYKQQEYMEKFSSVMSYIDSHYMEELNLEDIAKSIGFSKYHFSRLFKQYTNYTFCTYICRRRIKVAEELLLKPDLSITEVALQSGFPSISTFNRVFKQQKSCTPSEYREQKGGSRERRYL